MNRNHKGLIAILILCVIEIYAMIKANVYLLLVVLGAMISLVIIMLIWEIFSPTKSNVKRNNAFDAIDMLNTLDEDSDIEDIEEAESAIIDAITEQNKD